ncbi:46035_t:CDS:1, partial [Gigaspora margarita]
RQHQKQRQGMTTPKATTPKMNLAISPAMTIPTMMKPHFTLKTMTPRAAI